MEPPLHEISAAALARNAARRRARLHDWRLIDNSPEAAFDDLAHLAALVCDTPWSSINLLDDRRCWSKARVGPGPKEQLIDRSLCGLALPAAGVFVLPDASAAAAAGRGDGEAQFYAAAAIRDSDGLAFGTVCVMAPRPRPAGLTSAQADGLMRLARQAMTLIEGRGGEAYRLAFRHAAVDLVLISVHPDGEFTFLDLNDTHIANTGLHPETFVGRTPEAALSGRNGAFALAKYKECVRTGAVVSYEQLVRFPAGERVRRSFLTPLRDDRDRISRLLLTSIDQTELHAIQAQMRQSQKLEAMGQLASGLAHDFNNLLTAIVSNLELVATDLTDPARHQRPGLQQRQDLHQRIATALRAAERGGLLTQQLLGFGRPRQAATAAIDPNAVIGGMLDLLRRSLGGLIEVEAALAPDLWQMSAEASQLEQAILNLAINARDAMPDGGTLLIGTHNLPAGDKEEPSELPVGDFVIVSVTDEGGGMPPAVLERAMEPFFTTKPIGKGSGLGLAQVYSFAHQFGGTVRIDSTVGRGTRVTLILPRGADAEQDSPVAPALAPAPVMRAARILVVDDEPAVRDATVDVLLVAGHVASGAASGAAALAMMAVQPIDLVVADHAMPGMSGVELLRAVHRAFPAIRTLLMSGNVDAALQFGDMVGHTVMQKPFGVKVLLQGVEAALAGSNGPAQLPRHNAQGTPRHA